MILLRVGFSVASFNLSHFLNHEPSSLSFFSTITPESQPQLHLHTPSSKTLHSLTSPQLHSSSHTASPSTKLQFNSPSPLNQFFFSNTTCKIQKGTSTTPKHQPILFFNLTLHHNRENLQLH
ncbi:unnamed protein product [Lathyrus oleraceus]